MNRTDIINGLIRKHNYQKYLEIGVQNGANFQNVIVPYKVGVDPDINCARFPGVITATSDEYFADKVRWAEFFDIIFIDGLHLCWQVLKDVDGALLSLLPGGTIVLHDINPPTEAEAAEDYVPGKMWNGTVWQAWAILRMTRPDLEMYSYDMDWGVGIIRPGVQDTFTLPFSFWEQNRATLMNAQPENTI